MRVDITLPKHFGYINLIYKTFHFFHIKRVGSLYVDKAHRYCIFLTRKRIVIRIESEDVYVQKEITAYLENIFKNSYIGIPREFRNYIVLQGVDTYFV